MAGKIFCIIGKSATGKDTLYAKLLRVSSMIDEPYRLCPLVTCTTRPIRPGETNGKEYHFVTEEELNRLEEMGKVIEHRVYHTVHGDWHYFTTNDAVGPNDNYITIATLDSFKKLRNYYGEDKVLPIYITVSDDCRLIRAIEREKRQGTNDYSEVCRRYLADEADFSEEILKGCGITEGIVNDNLDDCFYRVLNIISKEILET